VRVKTYKREWLNPKRGTAMVQCRTTLTEDYFSASLLLTDCSNQIALEFDAEHPEKIASRLQKIDKIRAALDTIEAGLLDAMMILPTAKEAEQVSKARAKTEGRPNFIPGLYDEDDF
jgi:hypothetical protein